MNERAAEVEFCDGASAAAFLRLLGNEAGERLPVAEAGLALAALDQPRADLAPYRHHLATLAEEVGAAAAAAGDLSGRVAALNSVLYGRHGYAGDTLTYEDPQNANLMRVIDRRKGLPVALGIIAMHLARAQGWEMMGLAFPAHFLVRIAHGGERAILDPFNGGQMRDTAELRSLLQAITDDRAALAPPHYAPVSDREVLLRLQNNLKLRHLESREPAKALAVIEGMVLIAPDAARLWHEAGLIHVELGNLGHAATALERFLALADDPGARRRAATLLQRLRLQLN